VRTSAWKLNQLSFSSEMHYDSIIVGGSYAGLSAAMTLGRARRQVLVIDGGAPCNRQTPHSHNFLTQDGATPSTLRATAIAQVLHYPTVTIENGEVLHATPTAKGFVVETTSGATFSASKLVLATGITDLMPSIPGFAECWGISVLHCPYCHGYEVGDQRLGVLANGDAGFEFARLISNWSPHLTLFTNGPATLTAEQQQALARHNIAVVEAEVRGITHEHGYINALALAGGVDQPLDALFARVPFQLPGSIAQQLGCTLTGAGLLQVDDFQRTRVPGVFAAGDNSGMRAVAVAVAAGMKAGALLNAELITERFG
jgi:thioredoxin reductase